jgi:hypothetical protein
MRSEIIIMLLISDNVYKYILLFYKENLLQSK